MFFKNISILRGLKSAAFTIFAALVLCHSITVSAQINKDLPEDVRGLQIDEKLNSNIDLNLTFINEEGQTVTLKDYFSKGRPVVLNLVYYACPMICGMVTKGVTNVLRDVPWMPGREFEVVTISFDSRETAPLAKAKKEAVLADYGRQEARNGWHFLVDKDDNARKLSDQFGFKYRWIEANKQFAHGSVTFILTPEGKISRYLYGLTHEARDMRLALVEASDGKVGTPIEQLMMYCYHYDPQARSYVPMAKRIMQIGGVIIVTLIALMLWLFWRREMKKPEPGIQTEHGTQITDVLS